MNHKQRSVYLLYGFLLFIALIVLSIFVNYDFFRDFDYRSIVAMQKIQNPLIDYLFSTLTLLGSQEIIFLFIFTIFSFLYYKNKKLVLAPFLYILIYPFELLGKLIVYHPKPPLFLNRYVFEFNFPSSFIVETNYSYPSGHMARSMFLVAILFFLLQRSRLSFWRKNTAYLFLAIYLLSIFVSRLYLGEHWFSDCVGGAILGFSIANLSFALW